MDKRTNNELQNTTQKTEDRTTRHLLMNRKYSNILINLSVFYSEKY